MNKKISTLLASALLVGSASAYAVDADVVTKLEKGYYVLHEGTAITTSTAVGSHFQVVDGKLKVAIGTDFASGKYNQGLWTIAASAENSNHFAFKNKAEGLSIAFDPKTAVAADATGAVTTPSTGSELTGASMAWAWVANSDDAATLGQAISLTYAFTTDSTMALAKAADGTVFAFKYANAKKASLGVTPLTFQATKPASVVMKAADLNVLTDATNGKYFTLTPNKKDLKVDAITDVKFFAADGVANYVTLKELGTEKYLRVDTALHAATGLNENNLYQLARKALKTGETVATSVPNNFKIEKDLFKDKALISIAEASSRFTYDKDATDSKWATPLVAGATPYSYTVLSSILLTPTTEVMTLYSQNAPVIKENLLFTLSDPTQVADSKTSVKDGLYYIVNKKGQYLASPIYNNGTSAEWITINKNEQNVAHMPAFQWVVLKNNSYEYAAPKSAVSITNREFASLSNTTVQLNKAEGGKYYYAAAIGSWTAATDSLDFLPIEDKAILGDSLLGYKNLKANELLVNRYQFNYFNPYVSDKFIGKSTDSLLVVKDGVLPFVVKAEGAIADYGYTVANANGRIAGLKQLRRQAYSMSVPSVDGELKFGVSAEDKYAVSAHIAATVFYFKENNDVQRTNDVKKNDFYSLVVKSLTQKAGVADETQDATLKQQLIKEVRTSSFMIAPYDAPLYRRFNSEKLEGNVGDAADTLRFKEKYRGEYLQVEVNSNFTVKGIDFLGVYTPDFTKDGKSFIVDAASVKNINGTIKPQYLISIDRNDNLGTPGVACTETGKHYNFDANGNAIETDKEHCVHATPAKAGFHMGKYLVNFADSTKNAVKADDYKWKGYTRAGFVKAVHMGDSLYILTGKYADVTKETFKAEDIIADKKYDRKYIVNLQGDAHKLVTWSMRFIAPTKAANEVEEDRAFLMESQSADGSDIAPVNGQWLKMQNGCIVLSGSADGSTSSFDQITGADDALIFNVEKGSKEDFATENETITASTFSVIAKQGAVEIIGAAGKTVVISNILGQVIANTVITSDNATISVPAGVVVVAVEGEAAVKAIVK